MLKAVQFSLYNWLESNSGQLKIATLHARVDDFMSIQAIFFDCGGTLETYRQTRELRIGKVFLLRECLGRVGVAVDWSDEQLVEVIERGMAAYYAWNYASNIELPTAEVWTRFHLKSLNLPLSVLTPISEDLAFIYETQLYIREMRPEIPEVLEQIKGMGLKIGIVSNTLSLKQVDHSLRSYGITDFFDPVVLSSVYGRRKPDPSIFYNAARQANVPTGACVFVGDMINKDVYGARRAGFKTAVQILHPYTRDLEPLLAVPDAIISNMQELIPILESLTTTETRAQAVSSKKPVKAFFFDAGDILYYRPQKDKNLQQFLADKSIFPVKDFEREVKCLKELAFSGKMRRLDLYDRILRMYGINDPKHIADGIDAMRMDDNAVEIFEGVPETILRLKEMGFYLGIITDTAMAFSKKLAWFEQRGFGHVWDSVISSKEVGARKPSPLLYRMALNQVGVQACESVFVGHKATELDGARKVGMKTVAFNREPDAKADFYINEFHELLELSYVTA